MRETVRKRKGMAGVFALAAVLALGLAISIGLAQPGKTFAASLDSGVYEVDVTVKQAANNRASMCDGAVEKPAKLVVNGTDAKLSLSMKPVKVGSSLGYLGYVNYFPGYSGSGLPDEKDAVAADVTARYTDVIDEYNKEESSDDLMRAVQYPKDVELSWDAGDTECYLLVYVPVMNAISSGSGWQYARLLVDYSSAKRIGDAPGASSDADSGSSVFVHERHQGP